MTDVLAVEDAFSAEVGAKVDGPPGPMARPAGAPAAAGGDAAREAEQAAREAKRQAYQALLDAKVRIAEASGFDVDLDDINPMLKPMTRLIVQWACRLGRCALFLSFGLHKTSTQLEIVRLCLKHRGGHGLIIVPLGVKHEFFLEVKERHPNIRLKFIRGMEEIEPPTEAGRNDVVIYITNYETVRDGKLDPSAFAVSCALDEAARLRGFGGSKTFRELMASIAGDDRVTGGDRPAVDYRFVATAVPDPNEYIELLAYAAFLGIMDVGEAKTRFFKRDSEKADHLTIHEHKEEEWWLWVSSWALFVQKPSDLGFSDEGYDLPPLDIRWHELPADHATAGFEKDGQGRMFASSSHGVVEAAREKRRSLEARIAKALEIRAEDPDAHRIYWHDLEDERLALEAAIPTVQSVYGKLHDEGPGSKEERVVGFAMGEIAELSTKAVINGSGCNFQKHCWQAIYVGIGLKFHDFIQSVFRLQRFGQTHAVRLDLIYTEAERNTRAELERRWRQYNDQAAKMAAIIREYGIAANALAGAMKRSMGVERREVAGPGYRLVNNDAVLETMDMAADSVDLVVTSIPFSTQYEYTPSFNDFGHTDDDAHFWAQMDFLTSELFRVLRPGRVACIHVKDRIVPGGINGLGFQTVSPFSDACVAHFRRHGFAFLSRVTVGTDVVRENNQTYRLGWTEQCKDGTRMGNGMPEYLLKFRKPQTDRTRGYADTPVVKAKPDFVRVIDGRPTAPGDDDFDEKRIRPVPGTGYSRGRWQLDAHGVWRSGGNRPLLPDEVARLARIDPKLVYRQWKAWSLAEVYDHETHVAVTEALDAAGRLPPTFMIAPPHLDHPEIWTDVARMRTLNMRQKQKGREMHLCPLQFDIVDRAILQHSQPGETVYDPFGGIMTVPYCALKLGRRAIACELSETYFDDGVLYAREAAGGGSGPTLFDLVEAEAFAAEPAAPRTRRELLAWLQALPDHDLDRPLADDGGMMAEAAE